MTSLVLDVLVIDDEPPARRKIVRFLQGDRDIGAVREAGNGEEALRAVQQQMPDVVFLDIQMPAVDGFGVIERLDRRPGPQIIFTTAYHDHAIRAFEVRALDFLLKPFDKRRFQAALDRAKEQVRLGRTAELSGKVQGLLDELRAGPNYLARVMVKAGGRVFFLKTRDIAWIEGAANYVKLHTGTEQYLLRETLDRMSTQLDPNTFVRAHRSHIINVDHVHVMHPWSHGDYLVELKDGTELKLSRRYRDRLPAQFRSQL